MGGKYLTGLYGISSATKSEPFDEPPHLIKASFAIYKYYDIIFSCNLLFNKLTWIIHLVVSFNMCCCLNLVSKEQSASRTITTCTCANLSEFCSCFRLCAKHINFLVIITNSKLCWINRLHAKIGIWTWVFASLYYIIDSLNHSATAAGWANLTC